MRLQKHMEGEELGGRRQHKPGAVKYPESALTDGTRAKSEALNCIYRHHAGNVTVRGQG